MKIKTLLLSFLLLSLASSSYAATFELSADQDDTCGWSVFNDWQGAVLYMGYNANLPDCYIRWTINVPAESTINTAYVTFTANGNRSGDMEPITIYALDLAGSPAWQGGGGFNGTNYTNKTALDGIAVETGTSVSWEPDEAWTSGNEYDTPSLVSLFQNIVDDPDYSTSNPIGLKFYRSASGDTRNAETYDHDPSEDAVLTLEWTPPGAAEMAQVIIIGG